jgi:hypothetical protein
MFFVWMGVVFREVGVVQWRYVSLCIPLACVRMIVHS